MKLGLPLFLALALLLAAAPCPAGEQSLCMSLAPSWPSEAVYSMICRAFGAGAAEKDEAERGKTCGGAFTMASDTLDEFKGKSADTCSEALGGVSSFMQKANPCMSMLNRNYADAVDSVDTMKAKCLAGALDFFQ